MDTGAVKAYPVAAEWDLFRVEETPAEYVFHRPRLYLETTIPSFLTARPSRDLETARLQGITARWWNSWHTQFDIYVSRVVREEAAAGDLEAVQRRLKFLRRFPSLERHSLSDALKAK